jgi:hypothetical protein
VTPRVLAGERGARVVVDQVLTRAEERRDLGLGAPLGVDGAGRVHASRYVRMSEDGGVVYATEVVAAIELMAMEQLVVGRGVLVGEGAERVLLADLDGDPDGERRVGRGADVRPGCWPGCC